LRQCTSFAEAGVVAHCLHVSKGCVTLAAPPKKNQNGLDKLTKQVYTSNMSTLTDQTDPLYPLYKVGTRVMEAEGDNRLRGRMYEQRKICPTARPVSLQVHCEEDRPPTARTD
jgi:hypothetical protein